MAAARHADATLHRAATLLGCLAGIVAGSATASPRLIAPISAPAAPSLATREGAAWVNTPPLNWPDLRGRVVLLSFRATGCADADPATRTLAARFAHSDLTLLDIHAAEGLPTATGEPRCRSPTRLDLGQKLRRAFGVHQWPSYFLVDRNGLVRALYAGELAATGPIEREVEAAIAVLLSERTENLDDPALAP
ncbi:MAG: hypothetical protein EXR83_05460 [Gammaproteobacteria bacterium]|nr:hypothetical protein [Gammaproteobacteria bacterium]